MVVADFRGDTEVCAQEGGTHFGDQPFAGVAFIPEALAAEVAVEAGRVARPVGQLMGQRRGVALRVLEGLEGGIWIRSREGEKNA